METSPMSNPMSANTTNNTPMSTSPPQCTTIVLNGDQEPLEISYPGGDSNPIDVDATSDYSTLDKRTSSSSFPTRRSSRVFEKTVKQEPDTEQEHLVSEPQDEPPVPDPQPEPSISVPQCESEDEEIPDDTPLKRGRKEMKELRVLLLLMLLQKMLWVLPCRMKCRERKKIERAESSTAADVAVEDNVSAAMQNEEAVGRKVLLTRMRMKTEIEATM
ncbi:hypothetical protein K7X08_011895 [Anisodus acutangulus]|uniref:Uncharacterized protein n=1 Tax=Anisodus acutangulus TaxID=402998 RepID=A0A9Q1LA96_9SOLA|nr:hypothetical protein K7X08_011895 [Anisodus acutangulus]